MTKPDPLKFQCLKVFLYALCDPPISVMMREITKLEKMISTLSPAELVTYTFAIESAEVNQYEKVK